MRWMRNGQWDMKIAEELGEKRGERRGEKRGEKRGEMKNAIQTAERMLVRGYDFAEIASISGLSVSRIEALASASSN